MKQIMLLFIALAMSSTAFSRSKGTTDATTLTQFTPYVTMPEDVKTLLGEPTSTDRGKYQIIWKYRSKDREMIFYWDLRLARLQKYSYISAPNSGREFDQRSTCRLETGNTNLADALKTLGEPRDMLVDLNTQRLHYEFKSNVVNLYFHHGKLLQYQVSGLEKKQS